MKDTGLSESHLKKINDVLATFPSIDSAVLYGSRAMGNYKKGSDIDIALKGNIPLDDLSKLHATLEEETPIPYFFDITHYDTSDNKALKEHIDQYGQKIYPE